MKLNFQGLVSNWISNVRLQTALAAGFPSIAQQAELVQAAGGAAELAAANATIPSTATLDNGNSTQQCLLTGRSSSAPSSPRSGRTRTISDRQIIPARIISSDNEDGVEVDVE